MNFKKKFNNIFAYKPKQSQEFIIPNNPNNIDEFEKNTENIFSDYNKTLEYLKIKYNLMINSDINLREFEINIANKKFKSCLLFVDGLVNTESINDFILSPLLLRNSIKMNSHSVERKKQKTFRFQKIRFKNFFREKFNNSKYCKIRKNF